MSQPNYSILIPTRNGCRYLPFAVESVLSQPDQDFELIVSDNHSSDGTSEYLDSISDSRFRRLKPDKALSMVAHFEFIIAHAKGTWVTALGDDDGLMPFFSKQLRAIELSTLKVDAIVFKRAYFFWPGCEELSGSKVVSYYPFRRRRYLSNRWSVFLCLSGIIDYMHMPQLYTTGLVKRTYLEKIKALSGGAFFHGTTPDASSAAALALHSPRHLRIEEPAFWVGTSPKSVGFSQGSKSQKGKSDEFDALNRTEQEPVGVLPPVIKEVFDLTVLFYEALLLNPSAGWLWSTRLMRNFFLAGLALKESKHIARIHKAYGASLGRQELRIFMWLVRTVRKRYVKRELDADAKSSLPAFQSDDRTAFPTLREASATAQAVWEKGSK